MISESGKLRRVFNIGIVLAALVVSLAFASIVWENIKHDLRVRDEGTCTRHMNHLAQALDMYLADDGGVFPPAKNWCEAMMPYLNDKSLLKCPNSAATNCSYAYNRNLEFRKVSEIKDPTNTVVFFESDRGWDAAGDASFLTKSPRHGGACRY